LKQYRNKADLIMSLSAGSVTPACSSVVRCGGHLLASDAHSDARQAFLSGQWRLCAVWNAKSEQFESDDATLAKCFRIKGSDATISRAQVDESLLIGAISKRSFRLSFEPMLYLFEKI
jgi:hypothetical protein